MSWKGFTKAVYRLPQQLATMSGYAEETQDAEFNALNERFNTFCDLTKKLFEDAKMFKDSLSMMLDHQASFMDTLVQVFAPVTGHVSPGSSAVVLDQPEEKYWKMAQSLEYSMKTIRDQLKPELEVIERRIILPTADLLAAMEQVKKVILKRSHKLLDYDRYRATAVKQQANDNRGIAEEKKLGQTESYLDLATREYNHVNNLLKQQLPALLALKGAFVDPCFQTLFYYQLQVHTALKKVFEEAANHHFDKTTARELYDAKQERLKTLLGELKLAKKRMSAIDAAAPGGLGAVSTDPTSPDYKPPPYGTAEGSAPPQSQPNLPSYQANSVPTFTPPTSVAAPTFQPSGVPTFQPPPAALPPRPQPQGDYVIALYDFEGQTADDLSFRRDDKILVTKRTPNKNDWWSGTVNGKSGIFPANYVADL